MRDIKVYRVPQFMSKRVNVICVYGIPFCTARGKKTTSEIIAKLSGYDVNVCDGRIERWRETEDEAIEQWNRRVLYAGSI